MVYSPLSNIETLRVLAVILLVSFHAIGVSADAGLGIAYPHPLRLFADGLIDVRMPLFAFVSGWVYALRPITGPGFGKFWQGKVRRLIVPGLVAALSFWGVSRLVPSRGAGSDATLLDVITLSLAHFWFLQAIFIVLVGFALLEVLARRTLSPLILMAIAALLLVLPTMEIPNFGVQGAQYLGPFFLIGVLFHRQAAWIRDHAGMITLAALAAAAMGLSMNLGILAETGAFSGARRDAQSAFLAFGVLALLALYLPCVPVLAAFGPVAFTIYLYHVFGTSGMRRLAEAAGIDQIWTLYALTLAAGIAVPVAIHLSLSRLSIARQLVLGLRPLPPREPRIAMQAT